jgi:hypothetical protein
MSVGRSTLIFAEAGANVVINGLRDQGKLEKVALEAERFGVKAQPILGEVLLASVSKTSINPG